MNIDYSFLDLKFVTCKMPSDFVYFFMYFLWWYLVHSPFRPSLYQTKLPWAHAIISNLLMLAQ